MPNIRVKQGADVGGLSPANGGKKKNDGFASPSNFLNGAGGQSLGDFTGSVQVFDNF
jgi:hypothetical protein